ncbi:F-box-like domain-containing protein [Mycoavidus sp. B2-EB]|uniref:F-box-like domain-containing protein n=1 Tax=Mycoavidus sp. B2-EB TaxID=2651972 RepID=UPI00162A6517|nr:F-box-like domain-containing protein [Mycoavidus sp. B2-EB]BBO60063.1 hypothetical protein MPB2EB_1201 [Mycoavidus sp. B2-EB]
MTTPISNAHHAHYSNSAIARIQPVSQDDTLAARSSEATGSDSTSGGEALAKKCPPEILLNIFNRLPLKDIKEANQVCRSWEIAARERINIVVKVEADKVLTEAQDSLMRPDAFRPGREFDIEIKCGHLAFLNTSKSTLNWENIAPNEGAKSLNLSFHVEPSNFTGKEFASLLKKFPNLEKLTFRGCSSRTFNSDDALSTLENIKELDFSNSGELTAEILTVFLKKCPKLEKLKLSGCRELRLDLIDISLENLKELDLSNDNLGFAGNNLNLTGKQFVALLRKYPKLEKLSLSGCRDFEFDWVDKLSFFEGLVFQNLKELDLSRNKHTDEQFVALSQKFPKLEKLYIAGCSSLTFDSIDTWPVFGNVTELSLASNPQLTDEQFVALRQKFPKLEKLNISETSLTFDSWPTLENVTELNFARSRQLTNEQLVALPQKFPKLEKLYISGCPGLGSDWLDAWPTLINVKELGFWDNKQQLTDEQLVAWLQKFPNLEKLSLGHCPGLKFGSVYAWPTLKNLKKLDFVRDRLLSDGQLVALLQKLPNLERLNGKDPEVFKYSGGTRIQLDRGLVLRRGM